MSPTGRSPRIEIPRWIQLIGLPLLLVLAWMVAPRRALTSCSCSSSRGSIALLLDPLVRGGSAAPAASWRVGRGRVPELCRGVVGSSCWRVGDHRRRPDEDGDEPVQRLLHAWSRRAGQTSADRDVDRLQAWLNRHHLKSIKVQKRGHKLVRADPSARRREVHAHGSSTFVEGAAVSIGQAAVRAVLVIVVCDLHAARPAAAATDHRPALSAASGRRAADPAVERALVGYVRGQRLLSPDHRR